MPKTRNAKGLIETLDRFVLDLRARGYAIRTVSCYRFDLDHFVKWLASKRILTVEALSPKEVAEYEVVLATRPGRGGKPLTAGTRAHVLSALISFGKFLANAGCGNPFAALRHPRIPRKLPDNVLSVKEVERILAVPPLDDPIGLRDRAIMELLYSTGLRQSELLDLKVGDVDFEANEVRILAGKGGRGRLVPLCRESAAVLAAYLSESRPKLATAADSGHFFLSPRGGRASASTILKSFKRYAARAGIARPVGFHTFRHSCATHLMQRRAGLRYIQELLGHRSVATTEIYTRVTITDLKSAHARYHPRERMDV